MQIYSLIADWQRWLDHLERCGGRAGPGDMSWLRLNPFNFWNNGFRSNTAVGELFIDIRDNLSPADADRIGQFLAAVCPSVAEEGPYAVPESPGALDGKVHSALPPEEVGRRLQLLVDADLRQFIEHAHAELQEYPGDTLTSGVREVVDFLFMWASAFGAALAKQCGLIVVID